MGCGAWHYDRWFQLQWKQDSDVVNIAVKELIPILIGAFIWGKQWKGATITAHCNNAAVVAILNSRYTADDHMIQMLCCLFFVEAHSQFQLHTVHIPGKHTSLADHLSRNHLHAFLSEMQSATLHPLHVPLSLLQWLLHMDPNRTPPPWIDAAVQYFCSKGLADSTQKTYQSAMKKFNSFFTTYEFLPPSLSQKQFYVILWLT